jgi:hypothetical protein
MLAGQPGTDVLDFTHETSPRKPHMVHYGSLEEARQRIQRLVAERILGLVSAPTHRLSESSLLNEVPVRYIVIHYDEFPERAREQLTQKHGSVQERLLRLVLLGRGRSFSRRNHQSEASGLVVPGTQSYNILWRRLLSEMKSYIWRTSFPHGTGHGIQTIETCHALLVPGSMWARRPPRRPRSDEACLIQP